MFSNLVHISNKKFHRFSCEIELLYRLNHEIASCVHVFLLPIRCWIDAVHQGIGMEWIEVAIASAN